MTSAELKALIKDAEYLDHRDVVFTHILVGMVVALENIREELITMDSDKWGFRKGGMDNV